MSSQSALAARILSSLEELDQVVGRVELLRNKAVKTGDDGYWDGVALNLHGFSIAVLNEFWKILPELLMRRFLKEPIGIENF